eukprot:TRINITY_DN10660_c0_g1_i3.p1 TRINITY_DN10660_c0_g1~~TRINITY_DN10660_c0_g1_i3.p1  ORF type:complete len:349 (+),score=62.07 TRINITY_DN10660_c0_g1_i3:83-1129(+)
MDLVPHDGKICDISVRCHASRSQGNTLHLNFQFSGPGLRDVLGLGAGSTIGERADELWQKTCLEAFVRSRGSSSEAPYFELNFEPPQPFSRWQAYRFDSYRSPSAPAKAEGANLTSISAQWLGDAVSSRTWSLDLEATLPHEAAEWDSWEVFPTAVIQGVHQAEQKHYETFWALAHAEGKADFHKMPASAAIVLDWVRPRVTLVFLSGREETIALDPSDTAVNVQQYAAELAGQLAYRVSLSCDSQKLDPGATAASLDGATVMVTIRAETAGADISEDLMLAAFRMLDKDGNAYLSFSEWKEFFVGTCGFELRDEDLIQMFTDKDVDEDGHLNFEEFTSMMRCDSIGP